jgi:hypothetical protein
MTSARRAALVCAVAAVAGAAGAAIMRRAPGLSSDAITTPADIATLAESRAATSQTLETRARALEGEAKSAADVPQLRAALADGVDALTILDLFETEDWWAPFRPRAAALFAGGRILAERGGQQLPLPDAQMMARARETGVASGVLVGARAELAAVVLVKVPRKREPTLLMLAAPLDPPALQSQPGQALLLSDGHQPLTVAGTPTQQATLRAAIGKEGAGAVRDPSGAGLAVATSLAPGIWLWTLHETPADAVPPARAPLVLAVLALVLGLAGFVLWRSGAPAAPARVRAASGEPAPPRPAPSSSAAPPSTAPETPSARGDPGRPAGDGKRGGTRPYDSDDLGHRPTAVASGDPGATSAAPSRAPTQPLGTPGPRGGAPALAAARVNADLEAQTFGRYRLLDRLGEGGMAEIYTAVLHGVEGFRRVVVLKRLRPQLARNRAAVDQFIDEAKLGSTLTHSNIVPVYDFGKVGDEYFMAQEYVVGRDMTRVLQRHVERTGRPLGERVVLYVAHEILDALAYAHNQTDVAGNPLGLVHRDIAPGNIMVTARGDVKLFDFGIVKAEGRLSKTDVGVVKGNVAFMSPEQARGHAVDARSDLFSLGLMMYYCLTNDPLYPSESTFDQLMKAAAGPRTEHLRKLGDLPPVAARILARALSVDPLGRYQTAAEFAADLVPHIVGGKVEAASLLQGLFGEELRRESQT